LLEGFGAAEGKPGLSPRRLARHSALHVAPRRHVEMELHLPLHLALEGTIAAEAAAHPVPEFPPRHGCAPSRIRLTPRESFAHCARSAASRLRPARVTV